MKLSTSDINSYTYEVPSTLPPKCELNQNDTNEHAKLDRKKKPMRFQLYKRTIANWGKLGMEKIVFLKEDHKIWLSNSNGQHWKNAYKQHYMDKHVILRNIYVHALTILEERGHEFKGQ